MIENCTENVMAKFKKNTNLLDELSARVESDGWFGSVDSGMKSRDGRARGENGRIQVASSINHRLLKYMVKVGLVESKLVGPTTKTPQSYQSYCNHHKLWALINVALGIEIAMAHSLVVVLLPSYHTPVSLIPRVQSLLLLFSAVNPMKSKSEHSIFQMPARSRKL